MPDILGSVLSDPTVGAVGLAIAGAFAGIWLAATWWTFADISRRTSSDLARVLAPTWILVSTPALLPLSLGAYVLTRPQRTLAERREERLFWQLAPSLNEDLCPTCEQRVDPEWHRCPRCSSWLASPCDDCGKWSATDMTICPFCARDKALGITSLEAAALPAGAPRPTSPADRPVAARAGRPGNRGARDRRAGDGRRAAGSLTVGSGS